MFDFSSIHFGFDLDVCVFFKLDLYKKLMWFIEIWAVEERNYFLPCLEADV